MTDREKLIEILRKPIFPHELADPTEAVADYLLDNGVTVAKDTNVPSKWIPVTEKLPKPYVDVLILRKKLNGKGYFQNIDHIYIDNMEKPAWFTDVVMWKSIVTHWMPLPEPPKEE
jgi:hypothetical protein